MSAHAAIQIARATTLAAANVAPARSSEADRAEIKRLKDGLAKEVRLRRQTQSLHAKLAVELKKVKEHLKRLEYVNMGRLAKIKSLELVAVVSGVYIARIVVYLNNTFLIPFIYNN